MFTTRLAPELVIQVFNLVDPPTQVLLARTCSFLERCSRDLLRKQRNAHDRLEVVTDADPQSLVDIIRRAVADPGLAWHIRDLEFTTARTQWSHWADGKTKELRHSSAVNAPDYAFSHDEQVALLDQLRDIFHFDEQDIDMAREDLQSGNEAPMKLMLFAVCPRLRSVKFTRDMYLTRRGLLKRESHEEPEDKPRSIVQYFHQAVHTQLQEKSSNWPAGLDSLKDLYIGVSTRKEAEDGVFAPSHFLVTNMMQLPHLISLYCFGMQVYWDDDDPDVGYKFDESSSSVQNIFFSDMEARHHNPVDAMVSSCKELKSLTIARSDMDDVDILVGTAGRCHASSLETLMFYDTDRLHGYRCNMFHPDALDGLYGLRMVYVDASDVMSHAAFTYERDIERSTDNEWISDLDGYIESFMSFSFPETMEVLVLGTRGQLSMLEADVDFFDHAIAKMIEYERGGGNDEDEDEDEDGEKVEDKDEDRGDEENEEEGKEDRNDQAEAEHGSAISEKTYERSFPNLKAIYVGAMDTIHNTQARRQRWFQKAIAAGRKFGIDVHTRTTRAQTFHEVDFPKPPTFAAHKPTNLLAGNPPVFDVYTGRWTRSNCGNCGICGACLEQYDASVWKDIEDELARQSC